MLGDAVTFLTMKTQAERQKAVRERRIAAGAHRRLNMWISVEAYEALSLLARQQSITRMEALDRLLLGQGGAAASALAGNLPPDVPVAEEAALTDIVDAIATASPSDMGGMDMATPKRATKKTKEKKKAPRLAQLDLVLDVIASAEVPLAPPQQASLFGE